MLMLLASYYSPDDVRALPDDGNRYETVHGELLVTPAPRLRHQYVVSAVHFALKAYCDATHVGMVLMSPADISLTPDSLVQPDVFVVPPPITPTASWSDIRALLLAVEVVSPSSARADRFSKRLHYQRSGVPEYWVVDLNAEFVEVWTSDNTRPRIERESLAWAPSSSVVPLVIPLAALFR